MNISAFCIHRPVATILMSFAIIVGGLFAFWQLPVAALPRAEFPVVNVSANLPGASPDTMATSVATPLIKQFAAISGIDSISTSNSLGSTSIAIQFNMDRDIDDAAADVQAAIARTSRALPDDMSSPPSYRKVNPADAPILLMALKSDTVPLTELDAFANQVISPTLSTLEGVAQVSIFGSQTYAVRIQIDPSALAARGISTSQLQQAIAAANRNTPLGTLESSSQQLTLVANTQLENATEFSRLIIATRDGNPVRLGDVAKVIDSVANRQNASWHDGTRSLILAIFRQPDGNTVEVVDRVKEAIPAFSAQLPPSVNIEMLNDRSTSIREAVYDVEFTLALTIGLVVLVIFLFVRRVWATVIPTLAIPVSLIGTMGVMYLWGFSINNVSLMGMTLAVGLIVDDAIVMLENIVRHMEEEGSDAFTAALDGSREVGFTILSISVSLVAVFIPVLLMGGVIGRIFFEFAVVVTTAILISMFVSLTLTPMMASRLLAEEGGKHEPGAVSAFLERGFTAMVNGYGRMVDYCLRHQFAVFLVFLGSLAASIYTFQTIPKGFFPQEDLGLLSISTQARQDISFQAMVNLQSQVAEIVSASPHVASVGNSVGGGGGGAMNSGRMFVQLKPKAERGDLQTVLSDLRRQASAVPGISVSINAPQNLSVGTRGGSSQYQIVVQSLDSVALNEWSTKLTDAMRGDAASFSDVNSDLQANALQARIVLDRDKAASLGISANTLRSTLYSGFGSQQVATIYGAGDSYSVIMELDPSIDWTPERLMATEVAADNGTLVPVGAFARVERTGGLLTVNQLGQLPAVTISYALPSGESLGQALEKIEALKQQIGMPASVFTRSYGTAKVFEDSLANQGWLILGAIITIYIVLGMLYENFFHPLTILSGLPSAAAGALLALLLLGFDLSIIAVIGLLMLIGIVKKNAIMMVDVALDLQEKGMPAVDAIAKACRMRFRPIMMTTLAALMGVLPIAIGHGASAELRQPLGVAVVGGLIVSQALTLFITPVLFVQIDKLQNLFKRKPTPAAETVAAE